MKHIFITGVSRGLGQAYAEQFLKAGWRVSGTTLTGDADLHHGQLSIYPLDISKPKHIEALAEQLTKTGQHFDVAINNAGINLSTRTEFPTKTLSLDTLHKTLAINLIGLADLTERLLPLMEPGSQIVNISSGAGAFHPFLATGSSSYQISKAALNMYTKTLAARLQDGSVIVWSFDPGWVRTDMGGAQAPTLPEEAAEQLYKLVVKKPLPGSFWTGAGERDW